MHQAESLNFLLNPHTKQFSFSLYLIIFLLYLKTRISCRSIEKNTELTTEIPAHATQLVSYFSDLIQSIQDSFFKKNLMRILSDEYSLMRILWQWHHTVRMNFTCVILRAGHCHSQKQAFLN